MANVLKHVELSDLVQVTAIQVRPGKYQVVFKCLEPGKDVVFDEAALRILNQKLSERCAELGANHENTKPYIEEFVMRLTNELYKSGLCVLEDYKESDDDPYSKIKKAIKERH